MYEEQPKLKLQKKGKENFLSEKIEEEHTQKRWVTIQHLNFINQEDIFEEKGL